MLLIRFNIVPIYCNIIISVCAALFVKEADCMPDFMNGGSCVTSSIGI